MKKIFVIVAAALSVLATSSCDIRSRAANLFCKQADTVIYDLPATSPEIPLLQADRTLDETARILAGMDVLPDSPIAYWMEKPLWQTHKAQMDELWATCTATLDQVEALANTDFADINAKVETVFYPFSGPDFAYASSFYPKAKNYWLFALEGTGKVPDMAATTEWSFAQYRKALLYHLQHSYFITMQMMGDLHNATIDGTIPILMVFLARKNYHILSINYKTVQADGTLADSENPSNAVEIKFFNTAENVERSLYFVSANIENSNFAYPVRNLIEKLDPETTAGYTKACSYCMHWDSFSLIRNYMLNHTFAVIQDDTGVRYSAFNKDIWDITLYGGYTRPLSCFSMAVFQYDLNNVYQANQGIKPLGFRHGYNQPSSLIVARKK